MNEYEHLKKQVEFYKQQSLDRESAELFLIIKHAFMEGMFKGYRHGIAENNREACFQEFIKNFKGEIK